MASRPDAARRRKISQVQRQFAQWRRRRSPGTRIPDTLWESAIELAREHGVSKTSRALGLDYYAVKKRVDAGSQRHRDEPAVGPTFVEFPLQAVPGNLACVLEAENEQGVRLRLELTGVPSTELAGLVRSVWSEAR